MPGAASGRLLRLDAPISFWGGIDPGSGAVSDPRHPNSGASVAGRILAIPATIGSSSSSAIMLELLRNDVAPSGLLLGSVDAILVLGVIVARELGYDTIPVLEVPPPVLTALPQEIRVQISEPGVLSWGD